MKEIQGIPCQGTVTYLQNGKLSTCILARPDTILGNAFPVGTYLAFSQDGVLDFCSFPGDVGFSGLGCRGEGPNSWHTAFFLSGQLKLVWLAKDQEIQEVPCKGDASFWTDAFLGSAAASFHENGKLKTCRLSMACPPFVLREQSCSA